VGFTFVGCGLALAMKKVLLPFSNAALWGSLRQAVAG
jgi:hypothetical protein